MTDSVRTWLVLIAFVVAPPAALPQGVPGQPVAASAPPQAPQSATGRIRGRVVEAGSGQVVHKATVRLLSFDASAAGRRENKAATTGPDGLFEFPDLAAGQYSLTVTKTGYINASYGQPGSKETGRLAVRAGQTLEVDVPISRGAVVTGRVVDEFGEPMSRVLVNAAKSQVVNGHRRLLPAGRGASTNDLGEFRIFGLQPGQYYVQATVPAIAPAPPNAARADDHIGYASTLFPGVTDVGAAQQITLAAGDVVSDLSFSMVSVQTTNVSGTAVDSQGQPMTGVLVVSRDADFGSRGVPLRPDGTFAVTGLTPGDYTLHVQSRPGAPGAANVEVATAKITAAGDDITDLRLVATLPSRISGRLVVDPASTGTPPRLTIMAVPMDGQPGAAQSSMSDDGRFELTAPPGRVRLSFMPGQGGGFQMAGWAIRAVRVDGHDVIDSGIEVKANTNIDRVEIEITNRVTTVTGAVTDEHGDPAKDCPVFVFPQDRKRWTDSPRFMGSARTDQDGRFKVIALPPGQYYIVALDHADPADGQDAEFLERIASRATPFVLNEGETRALDLRVTMQR